MKFRVLDAEPYSCSRDGLKGKKNGVVFKICDRGNRCIESDKWYILCECEKTTQFYNSLWDKIEFSTLEKAQEWCEKFDAKNWTAGE